MTQDISRRTFTTTLAAFTIVPRHVLGMGYRAPSDTLNIACIGVGGMGERDVHGVAAAGEHIVALCDVDDRRAEETYSAFPRAKRYRDFREMLRKERAIDAVTISTPDHTHAVIAAMAIGMGKHVYCQKPLTRTLHEARTLGELARRSRVSTQMGIQGHAGEGIRLIREWVEAGEIGTVREIHCWTNRPIWPQALQRPTEMHTVPPTLDWNLWLGPAPERPYHPAYVPFAWRGWWDFGTGALGDIACHTLDAPFWVLGLGYPTRVEPETTALFPESAPRSSRVTFSFPARGARPAVTVVWRDGGLHPPRPPEWPADVLWPPNEDGGQLWIGDKGKLIAAMYGNEPKLLDAKRDAELRASPLPQKYPRVKNVYAEWIDACKAGKQPGADFAGYAVPLTELVLLGSLAVRTGLPLDVDPATGRVKSPVVPAEFVRPPYRSGWTL